MTAGKFPAALLTLANLGAELPNFPEAVLSGAHNAAVTTITLTATVNAAWPTTGGWVTIDSEIIAYAGVSGATLTGCTRASQSTTATTHSDAAKVGLYLTAATVNQMIADLIAVEAWLGASSNIASSGTTDLATLTGAYAQVTGTTSITAFGTAIRGRVAVLEFAGILTLTHNASSLILRNGANVTTAAGDIFAFASEGSGNWREVFRLTAASANGGAGGTPALTYGSANSAGSASSFIRTDDTIVDPMLSGLAYHKFHFEPINTVAPNIVVVGTGTASSFASRGVNPVTGTTNPSSASIRCNLEPSGGNSPGAVISKLRRLEIQGYISDTFANANAFVYMTDESADTIPLGTARHFGVKNLNGTISFTTADGTTEQTSAITAFLTAATGANIVITFDGTTAKCYIDGTLRATHATNVPAAGSASVMRAFINNNATTNSRGMALYCVDAVFANS